MMTLLRSPHIVRNRIEEAQVALLDLGNAVARQIRVGDLSQIEAAAARVHDALESAKHELADAVCDAEAALNRI